MNIKSKRLVSLATKDVEALIKDAIINKYPELKDEEFDVDYRIDYGTISVSVDIAT